MSQSSDSNQNTSSTPRGSCHFDRLVGSIAAIILVVLAVVVVKGSNTHPSTQPSPLTSTTNQVLVTSYRNLPSYVGDLSSANLETGNTYFIPQAMFTLYRSGGSHWYTAETSTPVLGSPSDAGRGFYQLTVLPSDAFGNPRYQITLPFFTSDTLQLDIRSRALEDGQFRQGIFNPHYLLSLAVVVPPPDHTLADYRFTDIPESPIAMLALRYSGYIPSWSLSREAGSNRGYIDFEGYIPTIPVGTGSSYLKVTHDLSGLTVCSALLGHKPGEVPATLRAGDIPDINYIHVAVIDAPAC